MVEFTGFIFGQLRYGSTLALATEAQHQQTGISTVKVISHSIVAPQPTRAADLERVVCDYCGSAHGEALGTLPAPAALLLPMHRLGATALQLGDEPIGFVRCSGCGFVYMTPRLTGDAITRFYDTVYSTPGAAVAFDSDQRAFTEYVIGECARFVGAGYILPLRICDIGVGGGQMLAAAQRRGWHIAGSEISAVAARRASEQLGFTVFNGDFRAAGYAPAAFDVVTLVFVVEHVRDPVAMLQAAADLLAPGGVLFVAVPSPASWEFALARLTGQLWRGFIIEHLSYFSPAFMRTLMAGLGLEFVKLNCWSPEVVFPNPLRDVMGMIKPSPLTPLPQGEGTLTNGHREVLSVGTPVQRTPHEASLQDSIGDAAAIPPLPSVSLPRRVVRQINNYTLDTVSALSAYTPASGNAIYVWARKPVG